MKRILKDIIRRLFSAPGMKIVPIAARTQHPAAALVYISAEETVAAARRRGQSLRDYVEELWNQKGNTQNIIESMRVYGAFQNHKPAVLEIGPGTGRYLEGLIEVLERSSYETYETHRGWAQWLAATYPIISRSADGVSLSDTETSSIDLLHAHGVFVYLPFVVAYQYFNEMVRVCRDGTCVVFNIISEDCLDDSTAASWVQSGDKFPVFLSTPYVVSLFERNGFRVLGAFYSKMGAGRSKYLVFRRETSKNETHSACTPVNSEMGGRE